MRVLVTIEEAGSFSAAGRRLRRSQSAISHTMRALEADHCVAVFDRSGHIPVLTTAGQVLARQARQVLRQSELFESTASAIAEELEPELTIAMDSVVPLSPLIDALAGLQRRFPELPVTLRTEGLGGAERRVRSGDAALALCILHPSPPTDLVAHPVSSFELIPVVAAWHPLAYEERPLDREGLAEHVQLVLTDPEAQGGPSYGIVSARTWRFVDLSVRLKFLLEGFGWATMARHLVEPHLQKGELTRLQIQDPAVVPGPIPIYACHQPGRRLGAAARTLLGALRQVPGSA